MLPLVQLDLATLVDRAVKPVVVHHLRFAHVQERAVVRPGAEFVLATYIDLHLSVYLPGILRAGRVPHIPTEIAEAAEVDVLNLSLTHICHLRHIGHHLERVVIRFVHTKHPL